VPRIRAAPGNPRVAVAYLRVSKEEQSLGPEAQRAVIEAWAAREHVSVARWCVDQGISGGSPLPKRPALQEALAALQSTGAGVLVIAKRDRIARELEVVLNIEHAVRREGAVIVSADGVGNGEESENILMRRIFDSFSEHERLRIRDRTKAALAVKRRRGERTGEPPYGYKADARGKLVPDDYEQAVIDKVFELRGNGLSQRRIAKSLMNAGIRSRGRWPLSQVQIHRILRRQQQVKPATLQANLDELTDGDLGKHPVVPEKMTHPVTAQPLVNRRVVRAPDYRRDGAACDVAWLKDQAGRLAKKGRSPRTIAAALSGIGVVRGDGSAISEEDVKRWGPR
jgi:DNA invertase Pin-like site-specific DNA recombinase